MNQHKNNTSATNKDRCVSKGSKISPHRSHQSTLPSQQDDAYIAPSMPPRRYHQPTVIKTIPHTDVKLMPLMEASKLVPPGWNHQARTTWCHQVDATKPVLSHNHCIIAQHHQADTTKPIPLHNTTEQILPSWCHHKMPPWRYYQVNATILMSPCWCHRADVPQWCHITSVSMPMPLIQCYNSKVTKMII